MGVSGVCLGGSGLSQRIGWTLRQQWWQQWWMGAGESHGFWRNERTPSLGVKAQSSHPCLPDLPHLFPLALFPPLTALWRLKPECTMYLPTSVSARMFFLHFIRVSSSIITVEKRYLTISALPPIHCPWHPVLFYRGHHPSLLELNRRSLVGYLSPTWWQPP